ncbi:hypothetical protein Dimus_024366 [Dionaea muscipula]
MALCLRDDANKLVARPGLHCPHVTTARMALLHGRWSQHAAARRPRLHTRWCRCSQPLAARRAAARRALLTQLEIAEVELPASQASVGRAKTLAARACCPQFMLLAGGGWPREDNEGARGFLCSRRSFHTAPDGCPPSPPARESCSSWARAKVELPASQASVGRAKTVAARPYCPQFMLLTGGGWPREDGEGARGPSCSQRSFHTAPDGFPPSPPARESCSSWPREDEVTRDAVKDVASPQKHKKRKLTKEGTAVATTSKAENIEHRKEAVATGSNVVEYKVKEVALEPVKVDEANLTVAPQLVLEAVVQKKFEAGRNTRSKGKTGDKKYGKGKQPPFLQLPPSALQIDPSASSSITTQHFSYATTKWTPMPHHSVLLAGADNAVKESMRHEWTRAAMMAKDQSVYKNIGDVGLNQLMTQAVIQIHPP